MIKIKAGNKGDANGHARKLVRTSERAAHQAYDVVVVGGGASGMMAAGRAAALGKRVLLLEKNKALGEKLKITGGGRCNITNATYDVRNFLSNYGDAADYLFSPFSQFGVKETFEFFESRGLPLVVQEHNRAFPHTEKARDVVNVLVEYVKAGKVTVKTGVAVEKIIYKKDATKRSVVSVAAGTPDAVAHIQGVQASGEMFVAKNYILATGGVSYPETGSTGDGFDWLEEAGHAVKAATPTIVPLATSDDWSHALSGISLASAKITFFMNEKKQFSKAAAAGSKILFTHFGLSGPLILNSATKVGDLLQAGRVTASIDLYPELEIGALDEKITAIFNASKNKILKNVLKEIVPEGMSPGISLLLASLAPVSETPSVPSVSAIASTHILETQVNSITKGQRRLIVDILKNMPVNITGLMGFKKAVVADGGVSLDEIDTRTMRSRLYSNLFVTGDLLHINRPSGGYSLQLCWTTGFVAGSNV